MNAYKPGDVGVAENGQLVFLTATGWWAWEDGATAGVGYENSHPIRLLAIIDPDDPDTIHRFADILCASTFSKDADDEALAAVFREFVNPKPPEPTGFGAVVECEDGTLFVRVADPIDGWAKDRDWQRIGGDLHTVRNFGWQDITAVKVLSEGVTR